MYSISETGNVGHNIICRIDGYASVIGVPLFGMTEDKRDVINEQVTFPVNGVNFQRRVHLMLN